MIEPFVHTLREIRRLRESLDNSQSLLAMILHLGTEIDEGEQIMPSLWEGEGLTKLLTEQIVENRRTLSPSPKSELVTTSFDQVSCNETSNCGWPECDCPRKAERHSPEAVTYAFNKARELLLAAELFETAAILHDFKPRSPSGVWMPIGTAPKDGSKILTCSTIDEYAVAITSRATDFRQPTGYWVSCGMILYSPPTHWMPLPEGPTLLQADRS